jgi:ATP-dependent DNA helicase RecG
VPTRFASSDPLAAAALDAALIRLPRPSRLDQPLPGSDELGAKAARALETLGLHTTGDLLEHLPRARGEARTVATLQHGETATVLVEVQKIDTRSVRRRGMKPRVEATVADQTGSMRVSFFNQPWLAQRYPPRTRLLLTVRSDPRGRVSVTAHAPTDLQVAGEAQVAQYPASEGIDSTRLLALIQERREQIADTLEPLPARLRAAERLPDRPAALTALHFPGQEQDPLGGRRRLAFDELLLVQLALLRRRARRERAAAAPPLGGQRELTARWLAEGLPFPLTGDQERALEDIDQDLSRSHPMQRLLMGEVGSGKTVVALFALLRAVEQGWQGALMAPTETLAEQHFATIQALMPGEAVPAALLTGSTTASRRADVLGKLASGELSLVVGTHALIEPDVHFARLAVAVVDEQHRFGVRQRAALDAKGPAIADDERLTPHVLHMTATPIPRTLALVGHGDLDHTTLKQLPRGRQPIETHVAGGERARARAYERIREELRAGRQAFVVCPLVEESEVLQAKAARAEFERLRDTELKDFRVVLMHGQLRPREKQAAMAAFAAGGADVLVATSVIEVGIDVPNATVMLVEDAERYGISQLHQLRGRIGRGEHASLCLLFGPQDSARLKALARHSDGFRLAQIDLELRREGELIGVRQHGEARFRVAVLPDDADLLERAHVHAAALLHADPELEQPEHALLAHALAAAYGPEAAAKIAA